MDFLEVPLCNLSFVHPDRFQFSEFLEIPKWEVAELRNQLKPFVSHAAYPTPDSRAA